MTYKSGLFKSIQAQSARDQLQAFKEREFDLCGELLRFHGVEGYDVYNPSIPFSLEGQTVLAGRVEERSNEVSRTMFFRSTGVDGLDWTLIPEAPVLDLQDPFVTYIQGELWLGGVFVEWDGDRLVRYATHFYRGHSLRDLRFAFEGPEFMKDIRLLELADGRVAVFSRPQGERMFQSCGCVAKIGMAVAPSIESVDADFIASAPLLEGQFLPEEWGGCNQLYLLDKGLVGVIGHKAWGEWVNGVHFIHYYSMAFGIHPDTRELTQTKIIAARDCYPAGPPKNPRTADVTFTSGVIRQEDGTALLYSGLSDCQVGRVRIPDPLKEYEAL